MIKVSGYFIILLFCINNIIRNKENFGIDFQFRGLFYITLLYFIYGLYISKTFRTIFYSNLNIIILIFLTFSIINGFLNNNEFYYIKEDFYNVLIVYSGILTPILIYGSKIKIDSGIIILISTFYFLMIIYFFSIGLITIGDKNTFYAVVHILGMFFPLLLFQSTRNKFLNMPNKSFLFLILIIILYETFVAFTRMNIVGILLSSSFIFLLFKPKRNFSFNINVFKNFIIISLLLVASIPLLLILQTGFIDRSYSDSYRLFEAAYIYQDYISENLIFGSGFGKTFITPLSNVIEKEAHIGLITIILKFGLLGMAVFLIIILKPIVIFIFHSDLSKLNNSNWIVLIVPSLIFWLVCLSVGKGTFPEHLFGLGLSIGSYIQFKYSMNIVNYNFQMSRSFK